VPVEATQALLTTVPSAFRARVNDVLLTALALAVGHWRARRGLGGDGSVLIEVEGHGREEVIPGVDLSRTVGWFTSLYPVRLDPGRLGWDEVRAGSPRLGDALKRVKEQLRDVPENGLGFGVLRYLNSDTEAELAGRGVPQIGFNYLGRFETSAPGESRLWLSDSETEAVTAVGDDDLPLVHVVEINAVTEDTPDGPRFSASLTWPRELLTEAEVTELRDGWLDALLALAAQDPGHGGFTPSDLSLVALSQEQIDLIEDEAGYDYEDED